MTRGYRPQHRWGKKEDKLTNKKSQVQHETQITIKVTSEWARWRLKSPASRFLLNRLFRHTLTKTLKLRVTGLCVGNSPVTGEFPAYRASNAETVFIWWLHHCNLHDYNELRTVNQNFRLTERKWNESNLRWFIRFPDQYYHPAWHGYIIFSILFQMWNWVSSALPSIYF